MSRPESDGVARPAAAVTGRWDQRFAPVREAFSDNFRERGELGGAVCVIVYACL
jgi:hypothetical protein